MRWRSGASVCWGRPRARATTARMASRARSRRPRTHARPDRRRTCRMSSSGGNGVFIGSATPAEVRKAGYVEHEYVAAGTATSYTRERRAHRRRSVDVRARRDRALPHPRAGAPARRTPTAFSGTVIVEWLNVSGGVDADPDWVSLHEEIVRRGDAWVGVSAQRIGVEGGPVLVTGRRPRRRGRGQGSQGDRSGALRLARASGRRLLVRHLHAGRPRRPRRRGHGRARAASR